MGYPGDKGEEGGQCGDGASDHLPRWCCQPRHGEKMERFSKDIKVDWVRMAQSVLRYNVVIVGSFFNKGSWTSEAWRKDHPEEFDDEDEGPSERILTA